MDRRRGPRAAPPYEGSHTHNTMAGGRPVGVLFRQRPVQSNPKKATENGKPPRHEVKLPTALSLLRVRATNCRWLGT